MENRTDALAVFDERTWDELAFETVATIVKLRGLVALTPPDLPIGEDLADVLDSVVSRLRGKNGAFRILGVSPFHVEESKQKSVVAVFQLGALLGEHLARKGFTLNNIPSEGN